MVVSPGIGVIADPILISENRGGQVEPSQQTQSAIYGIEGEIRQAGMQFLKEGFSVRMVFPGSNFSKNRQALMSHLEAGTATGLKELAHTIFNFGRRYRHLPCSATSGNS